VVSDLTEKVTGLSVDMMDAAKDMASHSQQSASTIIEKTDAWSESTAKRLESLLANIENSVTRNINMPVQRILKHLCLDGALKLKFVSRLTLFQYKVSLKEESDSNTR
jgi:hypothetical protein